MKLSIKKLAIVVAFVILASFGYFAFFSNSSNQAQAKEIVVYKEPDCQCCEYWAYYMKRNGYKVKIVNVEDLDRIKEKYGVPFSLRACHTAVAKGKVLEGHLPVEAVNKILGEGKAFKGISLPGMPQGVPGMGGFKRGILKVYGFDSKGKITEFFRF